MDSIGGRWEGLKAFDQRRDMSISILWKQDSVAPYMLCLRKMRLQAGRPLGAFAKYRERRLGIDNGNGRQDSFEPCLSSELLKSSYQYSTRLICKRFSGRTPVKHKGGASRPITNWPDLGGDKEAGLEGRVSDAADPEKFLPC